MSLSKLGALAAQILHRISGPSSLHALLIQRDSLRG